MTLELLCAVCHSHPPGPMHSCSQNQNHSASQHRKELPWKDRAQENREEHPIKSPSSGPSSSSGNGSEMGGWWRADRPRDALDKWQAPNPKIVGCFHIYRKHYAKGRCYYCYSQCRYAARGGRRTPNPLITRCDHVASEYGAGGMCRRWVAKGRDPEEALARKQSKVYTAEAPNLKIVSCEHTLRRHYSKGMCSSCYERTRRLRGNTHSFPNPKITACPHILREHRARGMCESCYRRLKHLSTSTSASASAVSSASASAPSPTRKRPSLSSQDQEIPKRLKPLSGDHHHHQRHSA